jgi:hypothetical protein
MLESKRQQERVQAYQTLGPLGILDLAEQLGIEEESTRRVLAACRAAAVPGRTMAPSQAYRLWILSYLQDGKSVPHEQVIQDAIEQGVIPSKEDGEHAEALNIFRKVACTIGVSGGRRGWWQLPQQGTKNQNEQDPF